MMDDNELSRPRSEELGVEDARKVGFVIAGAQKSGTTALFEYLHRHPQLCMHSRKELHYLR